MNLNDKYLEKWAKTRKKGRTRFIWLYGVLGWGLATGVIWALIMSASQGWKGLPLLLAIALIAFPIGGYFFGRRLWNHFEKHFEKAARDKPDA